ncbi:MAG: acyl-CoA thioesterase [Planctomycetes bacterium]|nr:acyl-CoA thioesterase [Planctomycetota bacterium]
MPSSFRMQRMVEFAETDMAGIMHFSNYFRFMEATEHAFFRSFGTTLHRTTEDGMIGWARVEANCTYVAPLRYTDLVEIELIVERKTERTLSYRFLFHLHERIVARGSLTVCCVTKDARTGAMTAVPMPDEIARNIEVAPSSLLSEAIPDGGQRSSQ